MKRFRSEEHKKIENAKTVIRIKKLRVKKKKMLIEYKGGECYVCGYNKCDSALDFHHLNPALKSFGFSSSGLNKSDTKLKKEADKCVLLCANCHREEHHKQRNSGVTQG